MTTPGRKSLLDVVLEGAAADAVSADSGFSIANGNRAAEKITGCRLGKSGSRHSPGALRPALCLMQSSVRLHAPSAGSPPRPIRTRSGRLGELLIARHHDDHRDRCTSQKPDTRRGGTFDWQDKGLLESLVKANEEIQTIGDVSSEIFMEDAANPDASIGRARERIGD
jgi:hypothetical protein